MRRSKPSDFAVCKCGGQRARCAVMCAECRAQERAAEGIQHGTNKGYHQHRYRKIPACEPCRLAHNEAERRRNAAVKECGACGAKLGQRAKTCRACERHEHKARLLAFLLVERARKEEERRQRRLRLLPCGTEKGYSRHRRDGEAPCEDCLAAHALVERVRKARRKQAEGEPEPVLYRMEPVFREEVVWVGGLVKRQTTRLVPTGAYRKVVDEEAVRLASHEGGDSGLTLTA